MLQRHLRSLSAPFELLIFLLFPTNVQLHVVFILSANSATYNNNNNKEQMRARIWRHTRVTTTGFYIIH